MPRGRAAAGLRTLDSLTFMRRGAARAARRFQQVPSRRPHGGKAIVGSMILLCFAGGALLGGVCTLQLPGNPLVPVVVLASAGMLLTMRERRSRLKTPLTPD